MYVICICRHSSSNAAVQSDCAGSNGHHHQSWMARARQSERSDRRLPRHLHQPERDTHPDEDQAQRAGSDHQFRTSRIEWVCALMASQVHPTNTFYLRTNRTVRRVHHLSARVHVEEPGWCLECGDSAHRHQRPESADHRQSDVPGVRHAVRALETAVGVLQQHRLLHHELQEFGRAQLPGDPVQCVRQAPRDGHDTAESDDEHAVWGEGSGGLDQHDQTQSADTRRLFGGEEGMFWCWWSESWGALE